MPVVKSASKLVSADHRREVSKRSQGCANRNTKLPVECAYPVDTAVIGVLAVRRNAAWPRTADDWPVVVGGWEAGYSLSHLGSAVAVRSQVR
jgi:hypothetical protein